MKARYKCLFLVHRPLERRLIYIFHLMSRYEYSQTAAYDDASHFETVLSIKSKVAPQLLPIMQTLP